MRFPRKAKVIYGQLDLAAYAGVLFLLAIFFLLHSQFVFIPGIRVGDEAAASLRRPGDRTVTIDRRGNLQYRNKTLSLSELMTELTAELKSADRPARLVIRADPLAPHAVVERARDAALELKLIVDTPGYRIELPEAASAPGVTGPTIAVAVNLGGQIFLGNQPVTLAELRAQLGERLPAYRTPPVLVILADKAVASGTVVQLIELARELGLEVLQAVRPVLPASTRETNGVSP